MADCCSGGCSPINRRSIRVYRRILWIALVVNALMFGVELVGGWAAGSVSLLADAVDFFGDAANYGISLFVLAFHILPISHAIHEVAALAVHFALDQPVHVGLEAREALVEVACEAQVVDDGLVEALARDQQRNARRVRRQQDRGDAAFQVVDRDALDLAVRHLGEGVRRLHRRDHVRQIHLGGQARHVVLLVEVVDLLAQVAQAAAS
jgi:hypothetical protein